MSMTTPSTLGLAGSQAGLAADARSLDGLKHAAGGDPKAIKEAARQFESLFMRELIKSMREATICLLYTSPSPRDVEESRMPSSA